MTSAIFGQTEKSPIQVKIKKLPLEKLKWPRLAEDNKTPLGVDVVAKEKDIIKIVHKFFKVEGISMEELLQEVFVAIIHKNCSRSAHDPRKSSFGHYTYMVANCVCVNLVHKKRRYDKERSSHDRYETDDSRDVLDMIESVPAESILPDSISEHIEEIEMTLRKRGMWMIARYIRATRSGASPEVVREALSWGNIKVTSKTIRDIRIQVQCILHTDKELM
jgi:hypothetical protein